MKKDSFDLPEKSLGCGFNYKGGRCDGENVENCVFEGIEASGVSSCHNHLKLMKIP